MIRRIIFIVSISIQFLSPSNAQSPKIHHSGDIIQMLEKLNTLGSVLYVAAHPDDENTQLISYFANGMHLRTGYLSATRGDGGQNLIGTEIKESLGVIRTQELLAARGIDGGEQFFSRAVDFGYSKHPDETFDKWDKDQVLADFVWAIRKFRPDIIVTRFNTEPGTTHGHHTASAMLAKEAFLLSGDPAAFPDQLTYVDLWEAKKIFWNASTWFFRRSNKQFNPDDYVKLDVGAYNSHLGQSYTEISAKSRSMHKSQGFGRIGTRGTEYEYLKQWSGPDSTSVFGGLDITWGRLEGTDDIRYFIEEALMGFDARNPELIVPYLLEAKKLIAELEDEFWKAIKLKEIDEIILAATGTYLEFVSDQSTYTPGDSITIEFEAINRSNVEMSLSGVSFSRWSDNYIYDLSLSPNQLTSLDYELVFSKRIPISDPYWLKVEGKEGMYQVLEQKEIGLPENPPVIMADITLKIEDQFLNIDIPVVFKKSDRVKGEVYKPIKITPPVMVNMNSKAIVYAENEPKEVLVTVLAGKADQKGQVKLEFEEGWDVKPKFQEFELLQKGEEQTFAFKLYPSKEAGVAEIHAVATIGDNEYGLGREIIDYDHIPRQMKFPKASTKVVKLDLKKKGESIGYVMGAGDDVPYGLEQMGYKVAQLEKDEITAENLKKYDAVVLGIRAFNTNEWLSYKNKELFTYSENGGTVIVQYNTYGTVTDELAPYPLKISRDRVSVEDAKVRVLVKKHEVLNRPNKITNQDFEDWVQERGLYFPNEWDQEYESILSSNDPGETPKEGSLLIAKHGKGYYVYTGLSFFRELPAGVPGAFRLMANLISLGKDNKTKTK
ncbi:MAG: PIG-L family deacetylase [Cyclobacteriaceae bacterium]